LGPTPILEKICIKFWQESNFEFRLTLVRFASYLELRINMGCKYIFIFLRDHWNALRIMWRMELLHCGDEVKSFRELRGCCLMEIALILVAEVLSILYFWECAIAQRETMSISSKVNYAIALGRQSWSISRWIVQSHWKDWVNPIVGELCNRTGDTEFNLCQCIKLIDNIHMYSRR